MGRAMRWLRGLLSDGGRKKPDGDRNAKVGKEKKGWSFARSFRDKERGGRVGAEVGGRRGSKEENKGMVTARSFHGSPAAGDGDAVLNGGNKQNERAIMVATATAAAAKAAVAAAQAAASVVRLTSKGGGAASWWSTEGLAAVKIQAVFRGYLARRALKALKGLVKLQALVRGHIVRKQTVEALRCMQALVRAQSRARAGREIRNSHPPNKGSWHYHHFPPTVANSDSKGRINCANAVRPTSVGRNGTRDRKTDAIDTNLLQSTDCNWLDQWMEERHWGRREALSRTAIATYDERNEKILEVDAGRPYLNAKRRNNQQKMFSSHAYDQNTRTCMTMPDSPSKDSTVAQYSVPSLSSVCMKEFLGPPSIPYDAEDLCESPQFYSVSSRTGSSVKGPFTSVKSECSRSHYSGCGDYPNYMSNTESSRAKVRSRSAPRQRPELEKSGSTKRSSFIGRGDDELSSTTSQRSSLHLKFSGKASNPGSGNLDKMGMPIRNL